ncbi:MAG TPA: alpha/beta family hydrolase [Candidatus Thermoplasmatota archaeon]|nr:alpha/beta family hydrolase [Candidatus Thermoplasmatota archaeon]
MPFTDRRDAGRRLARVLDRFSTEDPLVLGIPRGGVVVARAVADALGAPLDVAVARKLGAPSQRELALGAIAPGDVRVVDERLVSALRVGRDDLEEIVAAERDEMKRRLARYRGENAPPDVRGRVALVVDDGLATGATATAAVRSLRAGGASKVVLAIPVASPEAIARLEREADEVVCLEAPHHFRAVGLWYDDFTQTTDKEVMDALAPPGSEGTRAVSIPAADRVLDGDLAMPSRAKGLVVFAHGSGSGRASARNRAVAERFREAGYATLLFDLLAREEAAVDAVTHHLRFDVPRLADRVVAVVDWCRREPSTSRLPVALYGSSTGAAAALIAAAERPGDVASVVSRGGRPDLAAASLPRVEAPTLFVVGARDDAVLDLNRRALADIPGETALTVIPGAGHLFEEPGTLDRVAEAAVDWLDRRLSPAPARGA